MDTTWTLHLTSHKCSNYTIFTSYGHYLDTILDITQVQQLYILTSYGHKRYNSQCNKSALYFNFDIIWTLTLNLTSHCHKNIIWSQNIHLIDTKFLIRHYIVTIS